MFSKMMKLIGPAAMSCDDRFFAGFYKPVHINGIEPQRLAEADAGQRQCMNRASATLSHAAVSGRVNKEPAATFFEAAAAVFLIVAFSMIQSPTR